MNDTTSAQPHVTRLLKVSGRTRGYHQPKCKTCGWLGAPHASRYDADAQAAEHVANPDA